MIKSFIFLLFFSCLVENIFAQTSLQTDSLNIQNGKSLPDITVVGRYSKSDYQQMPEIVGTNIYAGKKNSLIVLDKVQGNIVTNTMRQVLAKVAGIHIWESDPSGTQIGIAARGLSPNRSWEFNTRQNGYDIAADPFGYPEAYYNPPLQAVQRIEIVRGQGSLQYGPQFGGLVNYILRSGSEIKKKAEAEIHETIGSNGLFNTFTSLGGKTKKINYYTFFDHRNGKGWRDNSSYFTNAGFASVTYNFTDKASLTAEVMHSNVRSQQPGGLTDLQFSQNAKQSFRSRNWFNITWTNPAVIFNYNFNENTRWNTKLFSTIGDRNSVGFTNAITVKDTINAATGLYNNRILNVDQYRNYGLESRIITDYRMGKFKNTISGGIRLYTGNTHRKADAKGTTGSNYDMTPVNVYPRNINFSSQNAAAFAENIFRLSPKFLIIPGVRFEWLKGSASGRNGFATNGTAIILQNIKRSRQFLLGGIGTEYHVTPLTEIYANYSQAYRPIQFANLQAPPTSDVVDPNLRDAKGYNFNIGYRGKIKELLQFDVSAYYLSYNNRVGTITPTGTSYRLITNVGNSISKGIETFAQFNLLKALKKNTKSDLIVFSSYSYTDAHYSANHKDANTKGKQVENAPKNIFRGGISLAHKGFNIGLQRSYTDKTFSDANNTVKATANGQTGLIPSYSITDISASYKFSKIFNIKSGINNLSNKMYFTRRAGGYPGPGVLPADGRNYFVSIAAKF